LDSAINIIKTAMAVRWCPGPLKPYAHPLLLCTVIRLKQIIRIVSRIVTKLPFQIRRTRELIRPIVEERFAKMEVLGGKWDDGPVRHLVVLDFVFIHGMGI